MVCGEALRVLFDSSRFSGSFSWFICVYDVCVCVCVCSLFYVYVASLFYQVT